VVKAIKDIHHGAISWERGQEILADVTIRKSQREATQPVGNPEEADEAFNRARAAVSQALKLGG
jgi:hypothetical protein